MPSTVCHDALARIRRRQMRKSFPFDFADSVMARWRLIALDRSGRTRAAGRSMRCARHHRAFEHGRMVGVLTALWRSTTVPFSAPPRDRRPALGHRSAAGEACLHKTA